MLIEFEDRQPAPPLSWGAKLFVAFAALGSAIALIECGISIVRMAASVARWTGLK